MSEQQLREQLKFEQFCNSFYLDFMVNHLLENDNYSIMIIETVKEIKENSKDASELNTNLKNLPGTILEKIKSGELQNVLQI